MQMENWVQEELQTVDLGDERLNRRCATLLRRFSEAPQASIPAACRGLAETLAAYRFFDNAKVSPEGILQPHRAATIERIRPQRVVLMPQDTTELDYSDQAQTRGLGPLNSEKRVGFLEHLTLALTPEGLCLGVVGVKIWAREALRPKGQYKSLPIEEKESVRWLEGYEQACEVAAQAPETQVVSIGDSDSDIYEIFLRGAQARVDGGGRAEWIVRAKENRRLNSGGEGQASYLRESLARAAVAAAIHIHLPRTPKRTAREACVGVRAQTGLQPRPPQRRHEHLEQAQINAVWVSEIDAPAGQEPIDWLLLTSLPVGSRDEILAVVDYYCRRWQIEIFFHVLKSGCRVEKLQLEEESRLCACIALYLIVAWRVLFVMGLGRSCPQLPCSILFEEAEWKALWHIAHKGAPPPSSGAPTLSEMVAMVASLGGYLGRKGDGPAGPAAIWRGLQRTRDFAEAWRTFGPGSG